MTEEALIDLLVLQWHTAPPAGGQQISERQVQTKTVTLQELKSWLTRYFVAITPARPLFILAPELSLPRQLIPFVSELAGTLGRSTVIIAGLEFLNWQDYVTLLGSMPDMPSPTTWLQGGANGHVVNAAGIWVADSDQPVRRFIQPKRHPFHHEAPLPLFLSPNTLLFRSSSQQSGVRINFSVHICSDFASAQHVQALRQIYEAAAEGLRLDLTFVLQCNEDQDAVQFKHAAQAYFAPPVRMIGTEDGGLVFINNANELNGKSAFWGRSKFHFRYRSYRKLDVPTPTYWIDHDLGPFDHQAVILRESGPSLYWLAYKPKYLVNPVPGSDLPSPFIDGQALWAPVNADGTIRGMADDEKLRPLFATSYWLECEWTEGQSELQRDLAQDGVEQRIAERCTTAYQTSLADWLSTTSGQERTSRDVVGMYFEARRGEAQYPLDEAEPNKWRPDTSISIKRMLRAYALMRIGLSAPMSIRPSPQGARHASILDQVHVSFMSGGGDKSPTNIITRYINARDGRGPAELFRTKCLLVLVNPSRCPTIENLALIVEKAEEDLSKGTPVGTAPHLQPPGEVVTARPSQERLRALCFDSDLANHLDGTRDLTEFEQRLQQTISRALS